MGDAHWPVVVQAERAAVAEGFGAYVVPDVVLSLDAVEIFERDSKPQRGGHVVVGDTDPLVPEIRESLDAGGGVDVERVPVVAAAQEDRQGRPIPFLPVGPFAGEERLRDGHLRDL